MKSTIGAVLTMACVASSAFATAQFPDLLLVEGKEVAIHSNPLEGYFAKHPQRRPKVLVQSSALWRGYITSFEIVAGKLRVKDVRIEDVVEGKVGEFKWVSVIEQVCPNPSDRDLSWFNGFLILPEGKVTEYVHMGYASLFERYRLLLIRNGAVAADGKFTAAEYAEYKALQFKAYSESERFKKMKADFERKHTERYFVTAENFLFIFDTNFPMETLIDYKDFRPSKAP